MKSAEVEIFGASYVIKGDADPEYVRELARYVDEKMRAAARNSPRNLPAIKVAVLAAINIADEYHKLLTNLQAVEKLVHDKTGDLFDILEDGGR